MEQQRSSIFVFQTTGRMNQHTRTTRPCVCGLIPLIVQEASAHLLFLRCEKILAFSCPLNLDYCHLGFDLALVRHLLGITTRDNLQHQGPPHHALENATCDSVAVGSAV